MLPDLVMLMATFSDNENFFFTSKIGEVWYKVISLHHYLVFLSPQMIPSLEDLQHFFFNSNFQQLLGATSHNFSTVDFSFLSLSNYSPVSHEIHQNSCFHDKLGLHPRHFLTCSSCHSLSWNLNFVIFSIHAVWPVENPSIFKFSFSGFQYLTFFFNWFSKLLSILAGSGWEAVFNMLENNHRKTIAVLWSAIF